MSPHDPGGDTDHREGGVRVTQYGLIVSVLLTIISAVSAGAWFMSAQSYTLNQLSAQQQEMRREIDVRRAAIDTDARAQDRLISAFDIRLTRIESQLVYLLAAQNDAAGRKPNPPGVSK